MFSIADIAVVIGATEMAIEFMNHNGKNTSLPEPEA